MFKKTIYYISHWESWHWFAKYILIAPAWAWFCLKSRTLWFFTPSNPTITFGGFAGETKKEVYAQLPPGTWPKSIFIAPTIQLKEVLKQMEQTGLAFPVAAKPDSGLMGFMFRKIETIDQLRQYHAAMSVDYIVQEFVEYPLEISVFYYRFPDQQRGTITGFLKKEFLQVTGDGKSTLLELILHYPRVQFRLEEMKGKHACRLHEILREGDSYCLSYALNLSRGGKLISLENEKDDRLLNVFDDLSHHTGFLYGRYDIRCSSVEELKEGKNYSILEFNGCGAEPHHVYGAGYTLWKACRILVHHWSVLDQIASYNHKKGIAYWSHQEALPFYRNVKFHLEKLKLLDSVFEFDNHALTSPEEAYNPPVLNPDYIPSMTANERAL
ncbi:MAG TPA: hypothetical protein VFG10_03170 [Saprospiraceae bacterium]|nr:hypothetical protein [Saprospiraceae bacterium]